MGLAPARSPRQHAPAPYQRDAPGNPVRNKREPASSQKIAITAKLRPEAPSHAPAPQQTHARDVPPSLRKRRQKHRFRETVTINLARKAAGKSEPEKPASKNLLKSGMRVRHAQFGDGIVVSRERVGEDIRLVVAFSRVGKKTLMEKYAKLQAL
jgi:hypothetical protein